MSDEFDIDLSELEDCAIQEGETEKPVKKARTKRPPAGSPSNRKKRIPLHFRNTIKSKSKPGFVQRVVNDVDDRIEMFKEAGWRPVSDGREIGDAQLGVSSRIGAAASKPVGNGVRGVLMEIPEEYYNEDQAYKQARVDATEKALMPEDMSEDHYGSIKIERPENSGQQSININVKR